MSTCPPSAAAAVLEYLCLFTHDLRRKQKRWQDGRLKYHTFNKRVMVYDERGNSVGDMHWRFDYAFDEGEELELERGGVIVQVSTLVARNEADLSELLDKRVKEKEQRHLQKLARSPAPIVALPRPGPRPSAIPPDHFQLRHRPLHQVIGTPTGHHGRALVPNESPFEQRQQAAAESSDERAAKRRKQADQPSSKSGYATSLFGQSLTLSATPANSVSVKRHQRPELNLDPPVHANGSSSRGEPGPVPREQSRVSRHLNQKSGYAQGLFGQSLTLSHTPVSSVPSRRQLRQEYSSDSTLDADTRQGRGDAQPALREQPKASRHFNQPASRIQTGILANETIANRNASTIGHELAQGIIPRGKLKEILTLPRNRRIEGFMHATPGDDDVIEIDDPSSVSIQSVQQPRRDKGTRDTARIRKRTDDMSKGTKPRQNFDRENSISGRSAEHEDEQESKPEKRQIPAQPKRTKPVAIKPATKKKTADRISPRTDEEPSRPIGISRRTDEHVTELKLRSRKRGLLMISDAPRKPRQPAIASSTRPFCGTEVQSADETHDGICKHPTQDANGELEDQEPGEDIMRAQPQRANSTELGESTDPFRSSSPAPQEESVLEGIALTKDSSGQQTQPSTEMLPEPDKEIADDGHVFGKDVTINQAMKDPSLPVNTVYDPYRIPSCSEEDDHYSWPASSPRNGLPSNNSGPKKGPADSVRGARKIGQKPNTAIKTRKQRPSRRMYILEDDEEPAAGPGSEEKSLVSHDAPAESDVPAMDEEPPVKRSKKTVEDKQRKSEIQDGMTDSEEDGNEPVKATRGRAKKQHSRTNPDPRDEQAGKRRTSSRQRRNRVDDFEESSLASELDVSEEEQAPKKRQCTTSKASVNRPRLEKIRKNIKSRELIGFNLAALNAPLGPRAIGMPFSILSSPVDESIQRRISNQVVMEASPDSVLENNNDQMSTAALKIDPTNAGLNRIIADDTSAAVLSGQPTNSTSGLPVSITQVSGPSTKTEEPPRVVGPSLQTRSALQASYEAMMAGVKETPTANKVPADASGRDGTDTMNNRSGGSSVAPPTKNLASIVPSRDHSIIIQQRANDCDAKAAQAKIHMLQAIMDENLAMSAVAIDSPAAQGLEFNGQTQRSDAARDYCQEKEACHVQVISESAGTTETASALPIATATSTVSLQTSINGLHRRLSTSETGNDANPESRRCKTGTTGSTPSSESATSLAQMPLDSSAQKSTSAQEEGGKLEGGDDKPAASEDVRVQRAAGSTSRSRMTAPFKRPTPAMQRQPSMTTTANEKHTSFTGEGPDPTGDDQSIPTYASATTCTIDAPLQEQTLTSVRPSLNEVDSMKGGSETSGEKPETEQVPAGPIGRQTSIGLRRPNAASRRVNNITRVRAQVEVPDQTADRAVKAIVKIVNPASRGRKAALASDAVGQLPQRVLPPSQPPLLVPISTADLACTPYEPPTKEPERPKRKMKFPGFQSARSEGPWSREAFDLLESGRPD